MVRRAGEPRGGAKVATAIHAPDLIHVVSRDDGGFAGVLRVNYIESNRASEAVHLDAVIPVGNIRSAAEVGRHADGLATDKTNQAASVFREDFLPVKIAVERDLAKYKRLSFVEIHFGSGVESKGGCATSILKELLYLAVEFWIRRAGLRLQRRGATGNAIDGAGGDSHIVIHPMRTADELHAIVGGELFASVHRGHIYPRALDICAGGCLVCSKGGLRKLIF